MKYFLPALYIAWCSLQRKHENSKGWSLAARTLSRPSLHYQKIKKRLEARRVLFVEELSEIPMSSCTSHLNNMFGEVKQFDVFFCSANFFDLLFNVISLIADIVSEILFSLFSVEASTCLERDVILSTILSIVLSTILTC